MNNLNDILTSLDIVKLVGQSDINLTGVNSDSRKVEAGNMFVATRGTQVDGHDYIQSAIEKGAVAIVCEILPKTLSSDVAYVVVQNANVALGKIASAWYDFPSSSLRLVGVTGTNGKTTIATLLYRLFQRLGYKCGLISTVCNCIDKEEFPSTHTTPDPLTLNRLLAQMVESGCKFAFMEVSSHAIDQRRIEGLYFEGGVFTNLTRDHLDYHKTFAEYLAVKKRFFDELSEEAFALTNVDDKNGLVMLQNTKAEKRTYSVRSMSDFMTKVVEDGFDGLKLEINRKEIFLPFIGKFNAYNLTAVYATALLLGCDSDETLLNLSALKPVSGRFEPIAAPSGYKVIVDYAHTPDALKNVLETIDSFLAVEARLITVVGCGGNRDKGKRPLMAKEAVKLSHQVIFTSDNPRNEEPQTIVEEMMEGVELADRAKVITILDRYQAIKTAMLLARPKDIVLIAGKGHENYQEINGTRIHFDDKEVVRETMV
ncbi:MAG: UDP-N-acetylmuramoyl-L-alanyl-D-glutamate--2,6-diaminopimelate ligase [Paludibacteraceae bacterium]|jgi:UDP-N-acetylmuramoyl-L-alanyl-D-glutamate--2,6-diaminopimelate ligase|nr:UDP-N-acetylmuramoyl-L-alanyl-D-glutamate--2,6-diaminopimelate ligase [Paludibacteraceae bacterium]MEE0912647.1 UDP-N-acetylmuramoyl-L-alanyl-D-glutamate--2,6-diaminopimelate ligase [Paludibacteraceae bacterium]